MELSIDKNKCLYCDSNVTIGTIHFQSKCCGRGMCQECYRNLNQGTTEQIQIAYFDPESEDVEILRKTGWDKANYICYECYENWAFYTK